MNKVCIVIWFLFTLLGFELAAQNSAPISVHIVKNHSIALPGDVINIPFFVENIDSAALSVALEFEKPENWNSITKLELQHLNASEKKFMVISIRVPNACAVGDYSLFVNVNSSETGRQIAQGVIVVQVNEIENISIELVEAPENIYAGETYRAHYLLKNNGNSVKSVFVETTNCDVDGESNVRLKPGESVKVSVVKEISEELLAMRKEFITVRAVTSGEAKDRVFHPLFIFPIKSIKKDLFFRFPIDASASYLATNQNNTFESAYQLELSGEGYLDQAENHHLEFLLRGPNNSSLSYLGLYDQYYFGYANKNLELTVGEQSYKFTPLTESSRYGLGVENKVKLNNGLAFGFVYVKPRFYEEIENEMAIYTQFEKDSYNKIAFYAIQKKNTGFEDQVYLLSLNTAFQPFKRTSIELEGSRGYWGDIADNAYRVSLNSQFSIFSIGGNYNHAGENYPGYYTNSTFYSAALSAQILPKVNVGMYARQDFSNAQLDTFFVTAPYSKSIQYFVDFNIAPQAYLKLYWRDSERKDRLSAEKFHYETKSLNSQFTHKIKRFSYSLQGEYGETTNYLLSDVTNRQNTYRVSSNVAYRFNTKHSVRAFGTYSNLNSFVSGEQRDYTAGLSVNSQILKKLKASLYLQNAYNIDDYYRNRNLMQFDLDYAFKKNHNIILRAYNTLFKTEVENSEFFISATYKQRIGVPLKQIMKAGDLTGRITNDDAEPMEGIVIGLLNKTTLTGQNGEFRFRSIPPGTHLLVINNNQFEIDEMPNIPMPLKVDIFEDNETTLNIRVTKGAKLKGKFVLRTSDGKMFKGDDIPRLGNVIVELKSEFKSYRITSNNKGEFSFPLVLPTAWVLKIYTNSLPKGFELNKSIYQYEFKSGDEINVEIDISQKKRRIIFKSQNISLSNSGGGLKPLTSLVKSKPKASNEITEMYYAIQIASFSKRVNIQSPFFAGQGFVFEKQIDNFYKYFVGRYVNLKDAIEERNSLRLKYKGAFVVAFKNNKLVQIKNQ